jgi:Protein of unknown function (DUF2924)
MTNPQPRLQLADLAQADKKRLVELWTRLHGQPPSFRASRELLILALAWEIQARKNGGLKPTVRRRMERLAKAYLRGGSIDLDPPLRYRPGTILLRQWKGQRHSVTILEEGYGYAGTSSIRAFALRSSCRIPAQRNSTVRTSPNLKSRVSSRCRLDGAALKCVWL